MRVFVVFSLLFLSLFSYSQYCPSLGPDQFLNCGVSSTTLTTDLSQCTPGVNPNQTTNYGVTSIPYVSQTNTGNQLFMTDDSQQGPFNIGFNFCFFGQTYTQFWVGSNGWISFSGGQPTTFTSASIASVAGNIPKNCIMGPWQDWHPGVGGQIRYQVQGVAPCRKLVVSWINMPMFGCTQTLGTFHIVIYESSNYIENHIQSKQFCNWANGTAVQGIHNQAGTIGITVPGRNSTQWVANNDAYRWTPSGPVVTPTLTWYQVGNPNPIGTGQTITVTPPAAGANYTCRFVYPTCNAGWSSCNGSVGLGPDTVFVQPGPPNLLPPIINTTEPSCFGYCDGTININPSNGTPPYNYTWSVNPINTPIQNNLCSGIYNVLITDANGCTVNSIVNLSQPTQLIFDSLTSNNVTCNLNDGEVYIYPNGGTPTYDYFINGNSSNDTITNLSGGNYTISVVDNNNCNIDSIIYIDFPTTIDISISPIDSLLCVPGTFNFINNSTPVANIVSSYIDYGDSNTDNIISNSNFTHTYSSVGLWDITLTTLSDYGCLYTETFNDIVETSPLPVSQFMISPNPTTMFETTVSVQDYSVNSVNWIWNAPGSLELSSNLQEPTFTYPEGVIADYIIYLTVQNELGCVDSSSVILQVLTDVLVYIPNAFTPGDDEFNSSWRFYLSGVDEYDFTMLVFNRWGQVIWECHDINGYWDGSYNGSYVQDGIYTWRAIYKPKDSPDRRYIFGTLTILR